MHVRSYVVYNTHPRVRVRVKCFEHEAIEIITRIIISIENVCYTTCRNNIVYLERAMRERMKIYQPIKMLVFVGRDNDRVFYNGIVKTNVKSTLQ